MVIVPCVAQTAEGVSVPAEATVESLFDDFVHYARLGRFTTADAFAKALLAHPDADPIDVLGYANRDRKSVETITILIAHSTIGESAARVLELIERGEYEMRKDSARIRANIRKLGGDPQTEYNATRRLAESGEYAIPWMVKTLLDPAQEALWSRVITALPKIGKGAVNPLVYALRVSGGEGSDGVRLNLIHALGKIGYPQAIPYLRGLLVNEATPPATRTAANAAIVQIEALSGRSISGDPANVFFWLAEKYYNEDPSVRANPALDGANVWYWTDESLSATVVTPRVFGSVMAMRCCEEALRLDNNNAEAIALWLAADIRRESRLGMDTESGDPSELASPDDDTRPEGFPRALYFTQAAGPTYAHLVLERAVRDQDAAVALGAIEALRITAGEVSLIGTEDFKQPLVRALQFPDLVVRIRAALALGAALPKSRFAGSQFVVPMLSDALGQTGAREILVIDPVEDTRNHIAGELRSLDAKVIAEATFFQALNRARIEFRSLAAIYVATDVADPGLAEAISELRSEFVYEKLPIIIVTKAKQQLAAEDITKNDPFAEFVRADVDAQALQNGYDLIARRTGQTSMDRDLALGMALEAAETLRRIAIDGRTVFDFGAAEPALIAVLSSTDERLQITAASVLALAHTETAQRSIAHVAMDAGNTDSLRIAAFGSLAESAKNNNSLLEVAQIAELVAIAKDDADLDIRTAASKALGAVNLKTNRASEIIRSFYAG